MITYPPTGPVSSLRRRVHAAAVIAALASALAPGGARADVVDAVNRARNGTCRPAERFAPLGETQSLDGAARALAHGASLHEALATLPVRPQYAAVVHLAGVSGDRDIERAVVKRSCADLRRPELREIGIARSGSDLYLVFAAPLPVPAVADRARIEREILARVNAARAEPRRCGRTYYPAAAPLTLSELLSRVAAGHSAAMGARGDLAHDDPDGTRPVDRVRRAGYDARVVGENIASGVPTATEVVAGWLASPGHCANIMDARFTEMGVAYALAPRTGGAIYWTQLLAARRS